MHYKRQRRGAAPEKMTTPPRKMREPGDEVCHQDDCDRELYENGLCKMHNMRRWRGATPAEMGKPPRGPRPVTECPHTDRPHGGRGMCASCYTMQWMREHPEANSGNTWLKNHPEAARQHSRNLALKRRGITQAQYDEMWALQEGTCANPRCETRCELVMEDFRFGLQVDHDHATGRVRGLLCPPCNRSLGQINDDAERLAGLIEYLGLT